MIHVKIEKKQAKYKKVTILGHALYDDYGQDIVCAAFSSILITTVNALEKIDKKAIFVDEKKFLIKVLKDDEIVNILINNMLDLFHDLEHDYPKNIKFLSLGDLLNILNELNKSLHCLNIMLLFLITT